MCFAGVGDGFGGNGFVSVMVIHCGMWEVVLGVRDEVLV